MRLQFSDEYLDKLEKFSKKYSVSKNVLFQSIEEALEEADEFDISYALEKGIFTCDSLENEVVEVDDECAGFQVIVNFNYLCKNDCTNWDQYFTHRLKEFKDKE